MTHGIRRILIGLAAVGLLSSCASSPYTLIEAARSGNPERVARVLARDELNRRGAPGAIVTGDFENLPALMRAVVGVLTEVWGEDEPEVASRTRYVKYTNAYAARAIVDFEQGWLRVETVAEDAPREQLRQAIVTTLLTPRDLSIEDIFTDAEPESGDEPFLLGQVLDHDDEAIRWPWRAERFADHLLANALERTTRDGRTLHAVTVPLVDNHLRLRRLEYADQVLAAASQYGVPPSLIYAVIEVESAFNPYAISHASAYGLMQVVPATAGRDVFERVKGLPGEPTRMQLFQPGFNIDVGSAYLHLNLEHYLVGIDHPDSRRYATIAAYNGGPGSTIQTFASNRTQALRRINTMTPEQVFDQLRSAHPFAETRRYVEKVRTAELAYR